LFKPIQFYSIGNATPGSNTQRVGTGDKMNQNRKNRRLLVAGAAGAGLALMTASAVKAQEVKRSHTFLLIHGAWHGAWCYSRVADDLRARGHVVHALTLSGLGERSHLLSPQIHLATHVDDIVNFVRWQDLDDFVLCAHSYGGIPATGAVETIRPRLRALVYLDAFITKPGQSLLDMASDVTRQRTEQGAQRSGGLYIEPVPAKAFHVNEVDQKWVDEKCTPQPMTTFKESLPAAAEYQKVARKFYVRALSYPSPPFDATAADLRARPGWSVSEMPYGHDLMVDAPHLVSDLLMKAAG
jgi:pimeloyl-ACP methyl ester carboxylesterase